LILRVKIPTSPSANSAYRNVRAVGRVLTVKARKWQQVAVAIVRVTACIAGFDPKTLEGKIEVVLHVGFASLETGRGAKHRFKTIDLDNRIKLTIDAVMSGLGLDDRIVWRIVAEKRVDPEEMTEVTVRTLD